PRARLNYLASPGLVVAYAIAGSLHRDLVREPLGNDASGYPVMLADIWPSDGEIASVLRDHLSPDLFRERYADIFTGSAEWRALPEKAGSLCGWNNASTYLRRPPFLDRARREPPAVTDIAGARILAMLGDGVTTDHISPVSAIPPDGPAGRYLQAQGVAP